jgi:hypothetical protein
MKMRHEHKFQLAAAIMLFALPGATMAQSGADAAAEPDLMNVTCDDYRSALLAATPNAKATSKDKAAALSAQDDLVNAMMWVHGYISGKAGPQTSLTPLTRTWMIDTVGKLAKACDQHSPDGKMRLADIVGKM